MKCKICRRKAVEGFTRCEFHREKHRIAEKRRKDNRKAAGLCPLCGKTAAPGMVWCEDCQAKFRGYSAVSIAAGICLRCKEPAVAAQMCLPCWFRQKARYTLKMPGPLVRAGGEMLREIWGEQGGLCFMTGRVLTPGKNASLDHRVPTSRGGGHERENLRWVDFDVNNAKAALSDEAFFRMCEEVVTQRSGPGGPDLRSSGSN